jgi:flagellar biosynthesis/type III secretory pathway protein FliH
MTNSSVILRKAELGAGSHVVVEGLVACQCSRGPGGATPVRIETDSVSPVQSAVFAAFSSPPPSPDPSSEQPTPDPAVMLEEARRQAEEVGYAAGYARGREEGQRALREQAERLRRLLDAATHDLQETLREMEPGVIELAMTAASKVIEHEVATHPDVVVGVVRAALAAMGELPAVRVRVHPSDHPIVAAVWSSLDLAGAEPPRELVADPRIQVGGCVIDTVSGFVDAQPATRLDELRMQVLPIAEQPR